ncbi:Signal transduction histidine-protein kinase BaeS [Arenibacter antarcticus]|uniref:histidine kinase n=1 Tax=Arenibacter antarcticus TaxID=2040469 RepID=A0ABW5VA57_9FLAO|nr:HAMP domain-containing sensor histidine kinase [Arenibacter sp. H213]
MKNLTTEIERLQEENNLKKDWISLITHDHKEAFGSLLWIIEALESGVMSKDDFFKLLPRIKQDAQKNLQTITDTSEWIKTQMNGFEPKKSKIFVLDLFIQLRKEFEEKLGDKNIDLQFKGDESLVLHNDELLLLFILKKLIDNAIKYSQPNEAVQFEAVEVNNTIILSITDHGLGMTEETRESLFTFQSPVFQGTKGEIGAGLSLKIAKNFVSLLHGKIEVVLTENVGTKIAVFLPRIEK